MARHRSWPPVAAPGEPNGLILFDGVCVLCSSWVRFVIERDPAARFRFVAVQSDRGRALAVRLAIDPDTPETNAVILDGQAYFKSDAAIQALSRLPGWSWVRVLGALPRGVRHWAYDRVARNRYRLFGRTDRCLMPTPELRRHFLPDGPG